MSAGPEDVPPLPPLPSYTPDVLAALGPRDLMAALVRDEDRVPRPLIEECARRGDAMLDALEPLAADDDDWGDDMSRGEWWLRHHAAMIAGLIASDRAGLWLVKLMRSISLADEHDLQDWLAGRWPALFRNKPDAVMPAVRALAEDRDLDWYIRCQGVESSLRCAQVRTAAVLDATLDWAARVASDEGEDWDMRVVTGSSVLDYAPARHRAMLEELGRRQSGMLAHFHVDDVARAYENPGVWRPDPNDADPWEFYTPKAIGKRQERWAAEAREAEGTASADAADPFDDEPADGSSNDWLDADDELLEPPPSPVRAPPAVGRNDPCPCGSGKKYKKCCLAKDSAAPVEDLAWRRLRHVLDEQRPALLRFVRQAYGPEAMEEAWREFTGDTGSSFDPASRHASLFIPWFCNFWSPHAARTEVGDASLHGVVPAAAYLKRDRHVDPVFRRYVESCLAAPVSVFEIVSVAPGSGFRLRDLLVGAELSVVEHSGSRTMRAGDLIIGQLGEGEGVTIVEASQGFVISPLYKIEALEFRRRQFPGNAPSAEELRAHHAEVVGLYREIERRAFGRSMPELRNTDGDPLSLRRVVFDVPSAQEALDALHHLAREENEKDNEADDVAELLRDAGRDAGGALQRVTFPWIRPGSTMIHGADHTVLGHIEIQGGRMTAHVNSEAREMRFREIVVGALGERARHRLTEMVSLEAETADRADRTDHTERGGSARAAARSRARAREAEQLATMPEVRAAVMELMAKHYEGWVHESLPILGGRTPMEAVQDADGREAVAALLAQFERDGERMAPPLDARIIRGLRARLGLG